MRFFEKENKENCNYSGLHVKHMYVHLPAYSLS